MRNVLMVGLMLSILGLAAPAGASPQKAAAAAATIWLAQVDGGKYAESWDAASVYFRKALPQKTWIQSLKGVRTPLGALKSRTAKSAQHVKSLPGAPDGNYVVMQFDTVFEKKAKAVETVTFMQETDGSWKAAGYFIK